MMRHRTDGYVAPGVRVFVIAITLSSFACSGDDDGPADFFPTGVLADFSQSGTTPGPNVVRIEGVPSGDMLSLDILIGGSTSSDDLYSFAFDLVLGDETIARYVPGSATLGPALALSGNQQGQVLATQTGKRITVGVTKIGGGAGNAVTSSQASIVTLVLQVLRVGVTSLEIAGSPSDPPAALDSAGATISEITFDTSATTVAGR